MSLDVPSYTLEEISLSHSADVTRCKISVITHWLNNDPEPSWRKLANALDECDYHAVATCIRQKYLPADGNVPASQRSADGDQRSRTPSPVSPIQRFHFRTNVFTIQPPPPTRTIVVSVRDIMHMSNFNVQGYDACMSTFFM